MTQKDQRGLSRVFEDTTEEDFGSLSGEGSAQIGRLTTTVVPDGILTTCFCVRCGTKNSIEVSWQEVIIGSFGALAPDWKRKDELLLYPYVGCANAGCCVGLNVGYSPLELNHYISVGVTYGYCARPDGIVAPHPAPAALPEIRVPAPVTYSVEGRDSGYPDLESVLSAAEARAGLYDDPPPPMPPEPCPPRPTPSGWWYALYVALLVTIFGLVMALVHADLRMASYELEISVDNRSTFEERASIRELGCHRSGNTFACSGEIFVSGQVVKPVRYSCDKDSCRFEDGK